MSGENRYGGGWAMVLVIEDDTSIHGLLCRILQQNGYEVQSAYDGWEGYELAMNHEYRLILMDLMLPMKSGEEILRELKGTGISAPAGGGSAEG